MKKILLVCSVLLGINCYSQTAEEQKYLEQAEASINDEVYGAFLKEVVKFRLSDDNLNEMYYSNNLIEKIVSVENSNEICSLNDQDFKNWVSKNLKNTKFSSIDEAVDTFVNYRKFTKLNEQKKKEMNLKLDQYKLKYGLLIDQEFRSSLAKAEINAFNKKFKS